MVLFIAINPGHFSAWKIWLGWTSVLFVAYILMLGRYQKMVENQVRFQVENLWVLPKVITCLKPIHKFSLGWEPFTWNLVLSFFVNWYLSGY
jgi:hypothetical protein